ncbi:hypothetical protein BECAL_03119 [Bellilinea caldifistulae]|uniref:Uncharacterized protein n=1 Tax=Bellilinea caldifistulae TaxID=360411 RepID=A0A0P6X9C7_9CHLR|nr:hypothetical protein [Bellilinea caldifistulae]KPL76259.1 hypothetical protein AC812_06150 [Bellilinea caldifistulae]GAP11921.1 hypothetical protein BECAL_03119 [Bellilinea caldifistulae]
MNRSSPITSLLAFVLFSTGLAAGLIWWGSSAWADLEASLFDASITADVVLNDLRCPQYITPEEIAAVSIRVQNPTDRILRQSARIHISYGFVTLMREENILLEMQPRESRQLEWYVTADDVAWGRLVLVRLHLSRSFPLPSRTATCGIVLVNLPWLNGNHISLLLAGITLAGTIGGWRLYLKANQPLTNRQRNVAALMLAWTILLIAGNLLALLGIWIAAGVLFLLSIIFLVISLTYLIYPV